jgi:hypothetical protein
MKLNHYLHLLSPSSLGDFLVLYGGFPPVLAPFSILDVADALLHKQIREIEIVKPGEYSVFVFWSSGRLVMGRRQLDCTYYGPQLLILSAYRGSAFTFDQRLIGRSSSIHPFAYNPEWVECFVLKGEEAI